MNKIEQLIAEILSKPDEPTSTQKAINLQREGRE